MTNDEWRKKQDEFVEKQVEGMMDHPQPFDDPEPMCHCFNCGCEMYEYDHYYYIADEVLCDSCADDLYGNILKEE